VKPTKLAEGLDMNYNQLMKAALANNVAPCFLEILGVQDERHTVGIILYHFNVLDEDHPKYKSTITSKELTK
jgi:hypothetical protein